MRSERYLGWLDRSGFPDSDELWFFWCRYHQIAIKAEQQKMEEVLYS